MKHSWFVIACLLPLTASAQTQPDETARRDLITQATQARDAGDNERALRAAQQAAAMRSSPSLRLLIAEIEVSLGRVLPALADGRLCVRELQADTAYRDWQRYMESCTSLVRSNEARVGRVVLRVLDAPGARLRVNDDDIPEAEWGTTREVVAGRLVIDATASGRTPFHQVITLVAGRTETVDVRLDPIAAASSPERPARRVIEPVVTPPVEDQQPSRGAGAGPWVVMGLGAASFAAAGVFFALREGALSDRDAACGVSDTDACPLTSGPAFDRAVGYQNDAHTFNTLTNVAIGVGGAALAGGFVWWLVGRNSGRSEPTVSAMVAPRGDGAVFGLRGAL